MPFEPPPPARYTPWIKGVYEVAPGLRPLGTDFGNGEADRRLFQFDSEFDRYADNKRAALRERRSKYVRAFRLTAEVEGAAIDLIARRLAEEYPDRFTSGYEGDHRTLSEEGKTWVLPALGRGTESHALDLLARLVAEDFAVVTVADGLDWVSYVNLCSPRHWAAEEQIGRSFFGADAPMVGFDGAGLCGEGRAGAGRMADAVVNDGPFVRFAWGLESDDRLNHHPEPPPGWEPAEWYGRQFDRGRFWVRVERQSIIGMPAVGAAMFVIRVSFVADTVVRADPSMRDALRSALRSMSPEARVLKGVAGHFEALLRMLE